MTLIRESSAEPIAANLIVDNRRNKKCDSWWQALVRDRLDDFCIQLPRSKNCYD